MPPPSAEAKNYTIFGHSLHSTLQASTCLYEDMPSHGTPYPGAPYSFNNNKPLFVIFAQKSDKKDNYMNILNRERIYMNIA